MLKPLYEVLGKKVDDYRNVYVKKIMVNKTEGKIDVFLKSNFKLTEDRKSEISNFLSQKLGLNTGIQIYVDEMDKEVLKLSELSNDVYKKIIIDALDESPAIASLLVNSEYYIEDEELHIVINNAFSHNLLQTKRVDVFLSNYIQKFFECKLNVVFDLKEIDLNNYLIQKDQEDKDLILKSVTKQKNEIKEVNKNEVIKEDNSNTLYGRKFEGDEVKIISLNQNSGTVIVKGEIFKIDFLETKNGNVIITMYITDYTSSIAVKMFTKPNKLDELKNKLTTGLWIKVQGEVKDDPFLRELAIMAKSIEKIIIERRMDNAAQKRVELHLHTQMSAMDAVASAKSLIKRAKEWGHKAIAITDHGVVQAFPEAMDAAASNGVKIIYGVEGYLVNDGEPLILRTQNTSIEDEFVVFDIETTGFNPNKEEITEIGAVKIKNFKIIDKFSALINPGKKLPDEIVKLTGITDEMLKDQPTIDVVLPMFLEFIGKSPVVAHNAKFDTSFIKEKARKLNLKFENTIIDTLTLSRWLLRDLKKHKLNIIAEHLGIKLENHHRAVDDAEATAQIFIKFLNMLKERNAVTLEDINRLYLENIDIKKAELYHVIILAKNYTGLRNLYKIISKSHIEYFNKRPRIPKSLIESMRDGLIIGSACEAGELYRALLNGANDSDIEKIVKFYDYLEIQPRQNNYYLLEEGKVENEDALLELNKKIVELGDKYGKLVVATGDVHFLDPYDEYFRRILMYGQGYSDADNQAPLYFKTTDEMLEEFSYLGEEKAYEVVIKNTNLIADEVEEIKPIPDETFPPKIEGAEEDIRNMTLSKAHSIYGENLPEVVQKRLDKELNSIINNGYAVMYLIAHKLVKKSLDDGYLVGSRGSVGSSFVATMCDITEVNPLPPHYVCPKCKNSEFILDGSIGSGADLPDKICPNCGEKYDKDGHDIPFEVFLGFEGDKEPDIDLNFSGEYQPVAHKYTEELFGKGHVFRAGTIGTIAEKTAFGFVKNYLDEHNIRVSQAEIERLVKGCTGVKRTTGQHPGGVMVVPRDNEIYEFTPVQKPADDPDSDVITTHFDYHSISGRLLKLDILGHDDPTVLRMLQDLTGIDPRKIPLGDENVLKLFTSTEPLGISSQDLNCDVGTLGLPEFGTKFVRQMLIDTQPKTFAELVRISGLSHGTDVWLNNAQDIIKNGYATLKDVISTRDDIMVYLIYRGLNPKTAFNIMERVRKGKGLRQEDIDEMKKFNVPEWYIESCNKIKYMFPKGHAVAYVMMAVRIAYFKVYYPEAFYATYFTVRADDFDADLIVKGEKAIRNKIREIEMMGNNVTQKDKGLLTVLEIALEMYLRGLKFVPVNLYKSDSTRFLITQDGILPPFKSLQGVGEAAARSIVAARGEGPFLSIEDLRLRSKASKTVIDILQRHGCLNELPETNQLSMF
ncbi:DNA polymerase III PolC-type [Caloramator mitchellensis]|uniref:DNA polymerase III PolC-type n=1 Tax=Caloramator mitchellensis TaxID=908809 RepID=A0A0R3JV71_CALMK|nr:PolC-type DNA polymerase III [Caloramator mitchellensis]KRQ86986.1 DNA polymerase III PolC-type [Caloramator mitchellensis]